MIKGSGYYKGYVAAGGNLKSNQTCIEQTFYLLNMVPLLELLIESI